MKKFTPILIAITMIMLVSVFSATALAMPGLEVNADCTWTGAVDTDWFKEGNWAANCLPDETDNALIPKNLTNYPVIDSADTEVNNLTIEGVTTGGDVGATVTVDSFDLEVKGDLLINKGGSLIYFEEDVFEDANFSPNAASADNKEHIKVFGTLTNNGTIEYTRAVPINSEGKDFVNTGGYRGVNIQMYSGEDPQPFTVIIKGNQECDSENKSVNRCFFITRTETSDVYTNIQFFYNPEELLDNELITDCTVLNVYTMHDGTWELAGVGSAYQVCDDENLPYSVQALEVTEFSPFVLANSDEPLAITMQSISANMAEPVIYVALALISMLAVVTGAIVIRRYQEQKATN